MNIMPARYTQAKVTAAPATEPRPGTNAVSNSTTKTLIRLVARLESAALAKTFSVFVLKGIPRLSHSCAYIIHTAPKQETIVAGRESTGMKPPTAEAAAAAVAAAAGNPALVSLIRELILIGEAIGEGISETKTVFAGGKVPLYEGGKLSGVKIGYKEYLYLFLTMTGRTTKIYRSMDVIELETRISSGYEKFQMDHCVDCFELEWTYQYEGLFRTVLQEEQGVYENVIKRKIYYER